MKLVDGFQRRINYLRLSVTDRCNLRCRYCMPADGVPPIGHDQVLRYEELERIARCAVGLGIEKIRITGGEPLVRREIVPFLQRLNAIPGLQELVLTTNGSLLPQMAEQLRDAGVRRLNVSLDSLWPERFTQITRCGELTKVLAGIEAAERVGLPVKLNMVVIRGFNDDEIEDFAALTRRRALAVRFIEYMPAVVDEGWQQRVIPGREILKRLQHRFDLEELDRSGLAGPSRDFRIAGAEGSVGVITPVFDHFCARCNRIRVTSEGKVRSCLFDGEEVDLKPALRGLHEDALEELLWKIVANKPQCHQMSGAEHGVRQQAGTPTMSAVGG